MIFWSAYPLAGFRNACVVDTLTRAGNSRLDVSIWSVRYG